MGRFQSAVNQTLGSISGALAYQKHLKMEAERRARAEQPEQKPESTPTAAPPTAEETPTTPVEKKQQWYDKVLGDDSGVYPDLGAEFQASHIAKQSAIAEQSAQERLEAKTNVRTRLPFEPAPPTIREGD